MQFGAIDIGSNAVRLLLAKVTGTAESISLEHVHYERLPIRLGEDVFETGNISNEKLALLMDALHSFKATIDAHNVTFFKAVATSAMRDAQNQKAILEAIVNETGIAIEIIDGAMEAELVAKAIQAVVPTDIQHTVIIDVGGGSTEISFNANGTSCFKSFAIGSIRHFKGKTEKQTWQDIQNWIASNLKENIYYQVFATGGNIKKVRDVLNKNGKEIRVEQIEALHATLAPMTIEERIERYDFKPNTAEVIVSAMDIYLFVLKALGATSVGVPEVRLSDGVISQLYEEKKQH